MLRRAFSVRIDCMTVRAAAAKAPIDADPVPLAEGGARNVLPPPGVKLLLSCKKHLHYGIDDKSIGVLA